MSSASIPQNLAPTPEGTAVPSSSVSRPVQRQDRSRISTACEACQKKKAKCEGGDPCKRCLERGFECKKNQEHDQRRKIGLKRKFDDLQGDRDFLDTLLDSIRNVDDDDVTQIVNVIRTESSHSEISQAIDELMLSATLKSPQDNLSSSNSGHPSSTSDIQSPTIPREAHPRGFWNVSVDAIESAGARSALRPPLRNVDEPPIRVPARPWTTVTDDDTFVSHLISLWFTWIQPHWHVIDRECFLEDMRAGNIGSEFCSPFLVNAVLADACPLSDSSKKFGQIHSRALPGLDFYNEAKKHLEAEEARPTLASLQGTAVLSLGACCLGKDRVGMQLLHQAVQMSNELRLGSLSRTDQRPPISEKMARAQNITAWGLFSISSYTSVYMLKPPIQSAPHRPRYPAYHHGSYLAWSPYPHEGEIVEAHTGCLFNSLCDFAEIEAEITELLFGPHRQIESTGLEEKLEEFHERIRRFLADLPDCMRLAGKPLPHVIALHTRPQNLLICMFGFLKADPATPAAQLTPTQASANRKCLTAACEVARLIDILGTHWTLSHFDSTMTHPITVSLFTLLGDLSTPDHRTAFSTLCAALLASSNRLMLAKGMLRLVQVTAVQDGVSLPAESKETFELVDRRWGGDDAGGFSSSYPNFSVWVNDRDGPSEDVDMDSLLRRWDGLRLTHPGRMQSKSDSSSVGSKEMSQEFQKP